MMFYFIIAGVIALLYVLKTDMEYDPSYKDSFSDYLAPSYLYSDGTILNKNGSITTIYKYQCDDMDHQTDYMLFMNRHILNDIFKRFDERYVLHIDSIRRSVKEYPNSKFKESILQEMDDSRKKDYISGKYYESDNYLSITYFPPKDKEEKIKSLFITNVSEDYTEEILKKYKDETENILNLLKQHFLSLEKLTPDEVATFLHSCISGEERFVKYIKGQYLDDYISDKDIKNDFGNIRIGNKYLRVISILSHISETECGVFDEISRLGVAYRWNTRYIYISEEQALKKAREYGKAANNERKQFMEKMTDKALNEQTLADSSYADELQIQADSLETDTRKKVFSNGYYSMNIILLNEDKEKIAEDVKLVMKTINDRGFQAVDETVNCLEGFFASIIGDVEHGRRKSFYPTYNLLSLIPITMDWGGDKINQHLKKEALIFCQSQDNSSFKFNNHIGDVGHTLVLGMTGAGKSVLLNTIAYQSKKYGSRVVFFDKGGSSRVLTRAVGGKFYNIGKDHISFQPLRYIHKESEKEWALEWLISILKLENYNVTPKAKSLLTEALANLATTSEENRTMTSLLLLLQDKDLNNILKIYTKDEAEGIYGKYFDNEEDDIKNDNLWQVFEMENIFDSNMLYPMLTYLFHRIETELFPSENTPMEKMTPTYLILDECWLFLDNTMFSGKIKDWLKTLRKKNVSVIMATQSLSDVINSNIKNSLLESCPTKIYLPNPNIAPDTEIEEAYYKFGLNEREIDLIRTSTPKQDYYIKANGGKVIDLNLTPLELSYVAASSPQDQAMCEKILDETEGQVDKFNEKWKEYKNVQ